MFRDVGRDNAIFNRNDLHVRLNCPCKSELIPGRAKQDKLLGNGLELIPENIKCDYSVHIAVIIDMAWCNGCRIDNKACVFIADCYYSKL